MGGGTLYLRRFAKFGPPRRSFIFGFLVLSWLIIYEKSLCEEFIREPIDVAYDLSTTVMASENKLQKSRYRSTLSLSVSK